MTTSLAHSDRVHDFLLNASSYPDHPKHVELRETHISWVYLTDRFVYKQKKPVKFDFLDFSTLEKRQWYCEQEVALNRRFSSDVYLSVVPVSCDNSGHYRLQNSRKNVEWLVKMVRLDEHYTLENLILNEELTDEHLQRLSRRLTSVYSEQAPAMVRSQEFLQHLHEHIIGNQESLLSVFPDCEATIRFVTSAQLRWLYLESEYFVQRVADGRVVDGHGDLRPEHIFFRRNRPVIIDCVEFNVDYRTNDVIDELAFLAMECERLGDLTIEKQLIASYTEATTDRPRPELLSFYKCYRACVRAKVTALRSTQLSDGDDEKPMPSCRAYLDLAQRYAQELGPRVVLIVGGLSGTGKSTLALALQAALTAEILQTDVVRQELFGSNSHANAKYSAEGRKHVYDTIVSRIEDAFLRSPTVVLDGTFSSTATRQSVFAKATALGAIVMQVQCECPETVAMRRIADRIAAGNSHSEARPELHVQQAKLIEPVVDAAPLVTIDTTLAGPRQVELVATAVRDAIARKSA